MALQTQGEGWVPLPALRGPLAAASSVACLYPQLQTSAIAGLWSSLCWQILSCRRDWSPAYGEE